MTCAPDFVAKRFGLITTNSLHQTFARRVVQMHLEGRSGASADRRKLPAEVQNAALCRDAATKRSLVFANSDHPWVDTADGAAVRIAITVGAAGDHPGELWRTRNQRTEFVRMESRRLPRLARAAGDAGLCPGTRGRRLRIGGSGRRFVGRSFVRGAFRAECGAGVRPERRDG